MTQDDLKALAHDLGAATKKELDRRFADLAKQLPDQVADLVMLSVQTVTAPLHDRIKALEQRPFPEHRGVWDANESYKELEMVSHHGSGWICKAACHGVEPGTDPRWKLFVKKGRDAPRHPRP